MHGKVCEHCKRPYLTKAVKQRFCSHQCATSYMEGSQSPTWKGGHRHWSPGRYGRDKDGLSWKTQRRLAWERDEFTCQHCHTKGRRNPDVHHKVPFRVSLSHALDNLICLCQKCHLTEEAKVQDQWGGQLVERPEKGVPKTQKCQECGASRKLKPSGLCLRCYNHIVLYPRALDLWEAGVSIRDIAATLGITSPTVSRWVRGLAPRAGAPKEGAYLRWGRLLQESLHSPEEAPKCPCGVPLKGKWDARMHRVEGVVVCFRCYQGHCIAQVRALRAQGLGIKAIAKELKIAVGSAYNYSKL